MKKILMLLLAAMLISCGTSESSEDSEMDSGRDSDSVFVETNDGEDGGSGEADPVSEVSDRGEDSRGEGSGDSDSVPDSEYVDESDDDSEIPENDGPDDSDIVQIFGPPSGIRVKTYGEDATIVSWTPMSGADEYKLFVSDSENGPYEELSELKKEVRVLYKTSDSVTNIHYRDDSGAWTDAPGILMDDCVVDSVNYKCFTVETYKLECVFNDGDGNWDNNSESNYNIDKPGEYVVDSGAVTRRDTDYTKKITGALYIHENITGPIIKYYKVQSLSSSEISELSGVTPIYIPHIGPYLTWNRSENLNEGFVVNFESVVSFKAYLEFRKRGDSSWIRIDDDENSVMHHISMGNLTGDSEYEYRFFDKSDAPSAIYSFRTMVPADDHFKFILASDMQDSGNAGRKWTDVAKAIETVEEIDFIVIPGDLAEDDEEEDWKVFFDKGRELFSEIVMMPVPGNHDTKMDDTRDIFEDSNSNPYASGTESFRKYFDLPEELFKAKTDGNGKRVVDPSGESFSTNGTYYSFKYGSALFVGLNSEVLLFHNIYKDGFDPFHFYDFEGKSDDSYEASLNYQYAWMVDKVKGETDKSDWIFMYWHVPPYNASNGHGKEQHLARTHLAAEVFGKVDWVFTGHEHAYQRFKPLRTQESYNGDGNLIISTTPIEDVNGQKMYGKGDGKGTGYMVLPPAGNYVRHYDDGLYYKDHYADRIDYPASKTEKTHMGFVEVEVEGKKITITPWGIGNQDGLEQVKKIEEPISYTKP